MTRVHRSAAGRGELRPVAVTAGILLAVALAPGCGRVSPFRAIERSVQAQLPRLIGPADRYEVKVSRSGGSLIAGQIPWIEIHGRNVRAIEGLNMDELEVRLEGVRFNRVDRSVREIAATHFEERINPLINLTAMPFPVQLSAVRIDGDRAVIAGTATLKPAQLQTSGVRR